MPLLFSLGIHDALAETKDALEDGEELLALDDVYAISEPGRTRAVYNTQNDLWDAIPTVPDLQCAWQILLQCARCHHLLRTLPPHQSESYAAAHDAGMRRTMVMFLHGFPGIRTWQTALPLSQCDWFGQRPVWLQGPIGHHWQTHST